MDEEGQRRRLEAENEELRRSVAQLTESKAKYKARTKQLLQVLEAERRQYTEDADGLEILASELRAAAEEKDLELRRQNEQQNQLKQQIALLHSQLIGQEEARSLGDALRQKNIQEQLRAEELKGLSTSLELERGAHALTSAEKRQIEAVNEALIQTIQSFIQVFNYTVSQLSFKRNEMPLFLQKVFQTLLIDKSSDCHVFPLFINPNSCNLQLLLSSNHSLQHSTIKGVGVGDIGVEPELLLQKNYLLEDQKFKLDEINFIPYKAFVIMQNFRKLNGLLEADAISTTNIASSDPWSTERNANRSAGSTNRGVTGVGSTPTLNQISKNVRRLNDSHYNQLLVSLSAAFQEYCQRMQYNRVNAIIKEQKKEIDTLNRKLQQQVPYDVKRLEDKVKWLRQELLRYQNLYKDQLGKKRVNKRINVHVGDIHRDQIKVSELNDEVRLLRTMVQNVSGLAASGGAGAGMFRSRSASAGGTSSRQYSGQGGAASGHGAASRSFSGAGTVADPGAGPDSFGGSGGAAQNPDSPGFTGVNRNFRSEEYRSGCIAAGRLLLQILELALAKLYALRSTPAEVLDVLREAQNRSREVLMEILEDRFTEV